MTNREIFFGLIAVLCIFGGFALATKNYQQTICCQCACDSVKCNGGADCPCGELECSCELDCKKN